MGKVVWLCEKANQARALAEVLGLQGAQRSGAYPTAQGLVTNASGHLLEQVPPEVYDPRLAERWSFEPLPILPKRWKVVPTKRGAGQLSRIKDLLRGATEVIVATDPDREGELIAYEILEWCGYKGPTRRLWSSGLDAVSLGKAVKALRAGAETRAMADAALARSRADWLVGMNVSRAATLVAQAAGGNGVRSVGRVQTPTLGLVVRRDREIEGFVPRDYYELLALARTDGGEQVRLRHAPSASPDDKRIYERADADALVDRATGAQAPLTVGTERKRQSPPRLYSLSGLQQECSKRFGWGAKKTLEIAQSLYDKHQALSYPRTDCVYLPDEQASEVGEILAHLQQLDDLRAHCATAATNPLIRPTVFNSSKLTAHHAIIPTPSPAPLQAMSQDERAMYVMVAQRYIAALLPDHEYDETRITMIANGVVFTALGRVPMVPGWKVVFGRADDDEDGKEATSNLPAIADQTPATAVRVDIEKRSTQPPKHYTEGTLIADMAAIAKFATSPAVKARLRETSGIGTEATRADTIATLLARKFIGRKGRSLLATDVAFGLYDLLDSTPHCRVLLDATTTALWEDRLGDIAAGKLEGAVVDDFVGAVGDQVATIVADLREMQPPPGVGGGSVRAPTDKMVALAKRIAGQMGLKAVPEDVLTDGAACSAWLDGNMPNVKGLPSAKQVAFAKSVAIRVGVPLPEGLERSSDICRAFLDEHAKPGRRRA